MPSTTTSVDSESERPRKRVKWNHRRVSGISGAADEDNASGAEDRDAPEEQGHNDRSSESGKQTKIYVATTCHSGKVAAASYNAGNQTIYVLEDTQENSHFDLTKMFLDHTAPDVILTSWKADEKFIDILRDYAEENAAVFNIRLAKDFVPSHGRDRLLSLGLFATVPADVADVISSGGAPEPQNAYDFMQRRQEAKGRDPTLVRWHAAIRLGSYASVETIPLCMASIGALLNHIVRERAFGELDEEGIQNLEVRGIESVSLNDVMHINLDALYSLQVFESENHASIHSDKTKEGLSLFAILNSTVTTLGRSLLQTWLLRPSCSLSIIQARHDAVACLLLPENSTITDDIRSQLKGIRNVPRCLSRIKSGRAKIGEWQGLVKFTYHMALLYDTLGELYRAIDVGVVQQLFNSLDIPKFKRLGTSVNDTIDWEESISSARICVRPHVDEELDEMKRVYHGIDSVLSKVAEQMWDSIPEGYVPELNVVYFPQLGFLVCVPMMEEWTGEAGIQVLDGWSFQFSSEAHVYFKSPQMHDLDRYLGDLHSNIVDREIEIVQVLLQEVLKSEGDIELVCDICAELDVLLSFAEASRTFDYRRPTMVEEDVVSIEGGRHPLQEQVVDTFVPNDLVINSHEGVAGNPHRILICTGSNACGKSVYLKQAALIQIMAQIGCFVPAQQAILGLTDKIYTRIQTRESVSKTQSAFMIDLNQVSLALRNCTSRSLIILDEFGKGTLPSSGLFCGVIAHLQTRAGGCPKVLAATHFHDVFGADVLRADAPLVGYVHMQVMLSTAQGAVMLADDRSSTAGDESEARRLAGKITYLYRAVPEPAKESHAALCAQIYGVPHRVVRRAQYITRLLQAHEIGRLLDEVMPEADVRELQEAEDVCRRFLAVDLLTDEGRVDVLASGTREMLERVLGVDAGSPAGSQRSVTV